MAIKFKCKCKCKCVSLLYQRLILAAESKPGDVHFTSPSQLPARTQEIQLGLSREAPPKSRNYSSQVTQTNNELQLQSAATPSTPLFAFPTPPFCPNLDPRKVKLLKGNMKEAQKGDRKFFSQAIRVTSHVSVELPHLTPRSEWVSSCESVQISNR